MNDFIEDGPLDLTYWRPEDYAAQWRAALTAFAEGRVQCCVLVTEIWDPMLSRDLRCWTLFNEDSTVVVQERYCLNYRGVVNDGHALVGDPLEAAKAILPRFDDEDELDEGDKVSEWVLHMTDIDNFLRNWKG